MLLTLSMRNVALIESLTLEFQRGLHVMTGETGAGKSIVVDAVNLVLGGRADRELIRTGTEKAWVEAAFDISDCAKAQELLASQSLEAEGGTVTLYREITRSGRNLCRVCGVTMPVAFLRELAALLMDVHGQHEHRFLMEPKYHMQFLDAFGGAEHQAILAQTAQAYQAFITNHRAYARLVKENERKNRRLEELRADLAVMKKAHLKPGEEESLTQERDRLRHGEKIRSVLSAAESALSAASEEGGGVVSAWRGATQALHGIAGLAPEYQAIEERMESLGYEIEEVAYDLSRLRDANDFDPQRAETVESRLDLIRRLERRFGPTLEDVLTAQKSMQEEYEHLNGLEDQVERMGAEHKRLLAAYRQCARTLTQRRTELARSFEAAMMEQLKDLGMEKTVFQVAFAPRPQRQPMPQSDGDDVIEFMISPNPGEPLKPLSKIASGGELSRLMLAIKSLEAAQGGVGTMVFDEIDTGISGRMAQVVAEKMAAIAARRQVLCVTHLPQIAAMADHQLLVEKHQEADRTHTTVRLLDHEGRVAELARMIGGAGDSDESARQHAERMLMEAKRAAGRTQ